jgi:hypothetical protein
VGAADGRGLDSRAEPAAQGEGSQGAENRERALIRGVVCRSQNGINIRIGGINGANSGRHAIGILSIEFDLCKSVIAASLNGKSGPIPRTRPTSFGSPS